MEQHSDTKVAAGVSLAIIVIAALVLLYGLVNFLKDQRAIDENRNSFFGTTSTTTVEVHGGTQTPAATPPKATGSVILNLFTSDEDDGDIDSRSYDQDNDTTSNESSDTDVSPTVSPSVTPTVSPSAPVSAPVSVPVSLPSLPILNNLHL